MRSAAPAIGRCARLARASWTLATSWGEVRLWFVHAIDSEDLVTGRVAREVEPASAAGHMDPSLVMNALGINAEIEIVGPDLVARLAKIRPRDVRFAPANEFVFVAWTAPGTEDQKHLGSFNVQSH